MNKQEFFLSIEPTAEEIAAHAAEATKPTRAPVRGAAKASHTARNTPAFQARAYHLWLLATNPGQIERNAEAARLEAEGNTRWYSDDGKHTRIYLDGGSRFYDVNTGETKR